MASLPIVAALVATACSAGSGDPSSSSSAPTRSTESSTSTPDYFTRVPTNDDAAPGTSSVAATSSPTDTVVDGTETSSTTSTPTNGGGSAANGPDQSSPSATSTTVSAGTAGASAQDQALAAAFTVQLDVVDDFGFAEVFDTTCLGREFVVAFGGAAAAKADYDLSPTTVTADSDLFNGEPLRKATADAVVDAFGPCGDVDELLLNFAGISLDDETRRCILDAIPSGAQEAALSEELQQIDGPALDAFDNAVDGAFDTCVG